MQGLLRRIYSMSEIVSTFSRVEIGDFNYLFFIIAWNDYMTLTGKNSNICPLSIPF